MFLEKVKIENIKSIKDSGEVYFMSKNKVTILAGQNESGKTSFLKSLRYFEEGAYDGFEDNDKRMGCVPRVECTFKLSEKELIELEKKTSKKVLDSIKKNGFKFVRSEYDSGTHDMRYVSNKEIDAYNEEIKKKNLEGQELEEYQDIEEFSQFSYFKSLRPKMVFYSSFLENNLPHTAEKKDFKNNQSIKDFQLVYDIDFDELIKSTTSDQMRSIEEKRVNKSAADSLNKYWDQKISNEDAEYHYNIKINHQITNPELSTVNFFVSQGDDIPLKISQKSHGFQWFTGFNLRLRAHEKELSDQGIILLIDEPGQGLHEVAQKDIKKVIEELASSSEKIDIIYTTHQPILLGGSSLDFSKILLVDKTLSKGTQFLSIAAIIGKKGSKDALSPLRSAIGLVSIGDSLSFDNSLIVEGITEYFILKIIFAEFDINIIPASGADQVPNVLSILYGWGVKTRVLLDDDRKGKTIATKIKKDFFNGEDSQEFKNTVLLPSGASGIEDLLSIGSISHVMQEFSLSFDSSKSKIENVKTIGKFIFARKFNDYYSLENNKLDQETLDNFQVIKDFVF